MHGLTWNQKQRFASTIALFQGFRIKKSEKEFFRDALDDCHMADINLTSGSSRLRYWLNHSKGNGKPISDLKLTNKKNDVLTFDGL